MSFLVYQFFQTLAKNNSFVFRVGVVSKKKPNVIFVRLVFSACQVDSEAVATIVQWILKFFAYKSFDLLHSFNSSYIAF